MGGTENIPPGVVVNWGVENDVLKEVLANGLLSGAPFGVKLNPPVARPGAAAGF